MADLRFSDHSEVIAALAVSEHTDNETLINARDHFIMAAKLAHGDEFNEAEALYSSGSAVTFTRPQTIIQRMAGMIAGAVYSEQTSPWSRFGLGLFKR